MADGINVDELSLVIKSSAEQALEQLNKLKQGLDSIVPQLERVAQLSGKKIVNPTLGNSLKKELHDVEKTLDGTIEKFQKKFADIKPRIDFSSMSQGELTKKVKEYQNEIAKNQEKIDRIMAIETFNESSVKSLESAIFSIQKATNGIKMAQDAYNLSVDKSTKEAAEWSAYLDNIRKKEEEISRKGLEAGAVSYPSVTRTGSYGYDESAMKFMEEYSGALQNVKDYMEQVRPRQLSDDFHVLEKQVNDLSNRLNGLYDRRDLFKALGVKESAQKFKHLEISIREAEVTLEKYEGVLAKAKKEGKLDVDTRPIDDKIGRSESKLEKLVNLFKKKKILIPSDGLKEVDRQIDKIRKRYNDIAKLMRQRLDTRAFYGSTQQFRDQQAEMKRLREEYTKLIQKQKELSIAGGLKLSFKQMNKAFGSLQATINRILRLFNKFINATKRLAKTVTSIIAPTRKSKKATDDFSLANARLVKSLTKTVKMFNLMVKRMVLRAVINGLRDGFKNLVQYSDEVNRSFSMLWNSMRQLNNSFAAATAPILNAFAPALNYVIQLCIKAVNAVNQLFAALTGQSTWIRATELTDDYAASLDKAGGAAKDLKKTVLGFDQLNQMQDPNSGGGGGGGSLTDPTAMFTEENVESRFKKIADKIKEIASSIFEPMKTAWDNVGSYVFDAWKGSINSVWELVKKVGSDFLSVWNESETIAVFENILVVVGRIGDAISGLSNNFREAWKENETGRAILQNIRDIIGYIVENFRNAADATRDWASNLNFQPFLEAFSVFTQSLAPVIGQITAVISDFYSQVLLPLSKWTLEKGLPMLLGVLTDMAKNIDWETLRSGMSRLWESLVPFAQSVGEGLILFIDQISDKLKNWVNTGGFEEFISKLSDWLSNISPQDVLDGLNKLVDVVKNIAVAFVALKTAWAGLEAVIIGSKIAQGVNLIVTVVTKIWGALGKVMEAFGPVILAVETVVAGFKAIQEAATDNKWVSALKATLVGIGTALLAIAGGIASLPAAIAGAMTAIVVAITGHWDSIVEGFNSGIDSLENAFDFIFTWLGQACKNTQTYFYNLFIYIGMVASDAWNGIKNIWGSVSGWFSANVIEPVKRFFADLWNGIVNIFGNIKSWVMDHIAQPFSDAFNSIKSVCKSVFNTVAGIVEGVVNGIIRAVNSVKRAINSFSFTVPNWVPGVGGKGIGFNIKLTPEISIPRYAVGGFPEDGLFMANSSELVGRFSNGRTAVVNNHQIIEGVSQGVADAVASVLAMNRTDGQSNYIEVSFVAGNDTIYRAIKRAERDHRGRYKLQVEI